MIEWASYVAGVLSGVILSVLISFIFASPSGSRKQRAPWYVAGMARTKGGDRPVCYGPFHSRWAARIFYKNWLDECVGVVTVTRGNPNA